MSRPECSYPHSGMVTGGVPGRRIMIYDTTLRDGSQSADVQFSLDDKLRIAKRLDEFGMDYIEGGWPGANPRDDEFFQEARKLSFRHSRLAAFGSTRRPGAVTEDDAVLNALVRAQTGVVTIFGKTWDLHVMRALKISLAENLDLIGESICFLRQRVDHVFYDAEHFFDGYRANPEYALQTLKVAREAGADGVILCDTNGGSLVSDVARVTQLVSLLGMPLGIHCHNDADLAAANTLAAVEAGVSQVQGTVNGIGERCGNADLTAVIPNLVLKMGMTTGIDQERLTQLTDVSLFVSELANQIHRRNQPYVGRTAFSHKGGVHVSAVLKDAATYEHIPPSAVGNRQRIVISDQAGRSNVVARLLELGIDAEVGDARVAELLRMIKEQENEGFQYDGAEASFELLVRRMFGQLPEYFELSGFRVVDERHRLDDGTHEKRSEASVQVKVDGVMDRHVSTGNGPVDALHGALRKALVGQHPGVDEVRLVDYKVRKLSQGGTDAKVRVLIEWRDEQSVWGTVGVSDHIIEASFDAMVDAFVYKLFKDQG